MAYRSVAQRRWLKRNKPGVAKKIERKSGNKPKANSKKRKGKRGKSRGR